MSHKAEQIKKEKFKRKKEGFNYLEQKRSK